MSERVLDVLVVLRVRGADVDDVDVLWGVGAMREAEGELNLVILLGLAVPPPFAHGPSMLDTRHTHWVCVELLVCAVGLCVHLLGEVVLNELVGLVL